MAEPALTSAAVAATDDIVPAHPNTIRADLIAHNHGGTVTPIIASDTIKTLSGSRTHGVPNVVDDTLCLIAATQTLTKKTFDITCIRAGIARVSTQFDKTDTTLANVTGLSLAVEAAGVYAFRAVLTVSETAAGYGKVAVAGTATATAIWYDVTANGVTGSVGGPGARATALGAALVTGTQAHMRIIEGLITVNAAGTLTVQYAQEAASGTSSVLVGSTFEVKKIP